MRFRSVVSVLTLALAASSCSSSSSKHAAPTTTSSSTTTVTTVTTEPNAPPKPTVSLPAATIVRDAQANAAGRGWVHVDLRFAMSAKTLLFSQDSGPSTGRQIITIGAERATVLLIDRVAYFNANVGALGDYFGLAPSSASLAGKWVAVKPSDTAYSPVSGGISVGDVLKQTALGPPFGKPKLVTIRNQRAVAVSGMVPTTRGAPEPGTLYVAASGEILPVAFDFSDPGSTDHAWFSAWGKRFELTAPKYPIAFSTYVSGSV